jgi:hypothetical protein
MSTALTQNESGPKLSRAMLVSAVLHALILYSSAVFLVRVSVPVHDPLRVTWIEPVLAPPSEIEEPGGSSGPAPEPPAPPKPVPRKPKPKPLPVAKKAPPPPPLNPLAEKTAPVQPPSDSLSARLPENEYVDLGNLGGGAWGPGAGRGRGGLFGDGVGAGVAPRRPIIYLSRSMHNPKRKDLEVYDKMFWHVIDHWEVPPVYRDRTDLIASVNVRFDRDGSITKFKFVRKSGEPAFDDTVIHAVVLANPLPRPTREFYQRFFDSGVDFVIEPKKIYFYSWPDPYAKKRGRFGF